MDKEYVGYALMAIGIALLALGTLNAAGLINFQITDTTPPTVLYSYPAIGGMYKPNELDEFVLYVQDSESIIASASYRDTKQTVPLYVVPYTQLKHPMTVVRGDVICKFPDVNFDGYVDGNDIALIEQAKDNYAKGQPWDPNCDVYPDRIMDIKDTSLCNKFYGTIVFRNVNTVQYESGKVSFTFTAVNAYGLSVTYSGSFQIETTFTVLSGVWMINGIPVNSSTTLEVPSNGIIVTFNCIDRTVNESAVTVKVVVGNSTYILPRIASYLWEKSITLSPGKNILLLEASTPTQTNRVTTCVITPSPSEPKLPIAHVMLAVGITLLISGIIIYKKEEMEF